MDRLKALQTFLDVAKTESLSAVARDEGVTPAMIGRRIDQLEEQLNVKLFKRSTRKITLLFLAVLAYFAFLTGPVAHARYRVPIEPVIFILSLSGFYIASQKLGQKFLFKHTHHS